MTFDYGHLTHILTGLLAAAGTYGAIAYRVGRKTSRWDGGVKDLAELKKDYDAFKATAMTDKDCEKCNADLEDQIERHYQETEARAKEVKSDLGVQMTQIHSEITNVLTEVKRNSEVVGTLGRDLSELKGSVEQFHENYYRKKK
jgi:hypothetical protein